MWRSILAHGLICAALGTAVLAFAHGLMVLGQLCTGVYPTFWRFALDVAITTALIALSTGFGIAANAADKASA